MDAPPRARFPCFTIVVALALRGWQAAQLDLSTQRINDPQDIFESQRGLPRYLRQRLSGICNRVELKGAPTNGFLLLLAWQYGALREVRGPRMFRIEYYVGY